MNRGYVHLWRKSLDAGWIKNHKLWAFWTWCLMKASYQEYDIIVGLQNVHLTPGQFIFGRKKCAEETGLSEREIRTIIAFLKKSGNLTIKTTNKFSIITVVNWHIYQSKESENDQQNDQPLTNKGPQTIIKELKNKIPEEISSRISVLQERYFSDQEIIHQVFQAIASTRKSNRIADSVKLSILQEWEMYPLDQVTAGIMTYLEKGYADQGKRENYLLAIIRNSEGPKPEKQQGETMRSTGSLLLDNHYRSQGIRII